MVAQIHERTYCPSTVCLRRVKMVSFVLCIFSHSKEEVVLLNYVDNK